MRLATPCQSTLRRPACKLVTLRQRYQFQCLFRRWCTPTIEDRDFLRLELERPRLAVFFDARLRWRLLSRAPNGGLFE